MGGGPTLNKKFVVPPPVITLSTGGDNPGCTRRIILLVNVYQNMVFEVCEAIRNLGFNSLNSTSLCFLCLLLHLEPT